MSTIRRSILLVLMLPFHVFAQEKKLDVKAVYERSIQEYIALHPEDIVLTERKKYLFIRQAPYLKNLRDTINNVHVIFFDPDSAALVLPEYITGRKKFTVLQIQQLFTRNTVNFVYFYSMKAAWNGKKKKFKTPQYDNRLCRIDFDYRLEEGVINYYYKNTTCDITQ